MKLFRHGEVGKERPGVFLADGRRLDLGAEIRDFDEAFFTEVGLEGLRKLVSEKGASLPAVLTGQRLGACVARPSKIVCIGLNYRDHARESKAEIPKEPVVFMKATTALCGPFDNVLIPRGAKKLDWEVEMAVVIGKTCRHVAEVDARSHIFGYALHNDYSEREFQLERGGQWDKGKGCDTFAPLGPWLVSADEVPDPQALGLWLDVNGKRMQTGETAKMIFGVDYLVSYVSRFMTLLPGDVISTGTPAGVGLGFDPPVYLKEGDLVELGIDILGASRQRVGQAA